MSGLKLACPLELIQFESGKRDQFNEGVDMPRKRFTPEEIIVKPGDAEVLISQSRTLSMDFRSLRLTDQTYYRWRNEYGE